MANDSRGCFLLAMMFIYENRKCSCLYFEVWILRSDMMIVQPMNQYDYTQCDYSRQLERVDNLATPHQHNHHWCSVINSRYCKRYGTNPSGTCQLVDYPTAKHSLERSARMYEVTREIIEITPAYSDLMNGRTRVTDQSPDFHSYVRKLTYPRKGRNTRLRKQSKNEK